MTKQEFIDIATLHNISSEDAMQLFNGIKSYFDAAIEGISDYKNDFEIKQNEEYKMEIKDCNHKQIMYIVNCILNETDNDELSNNKQTFLLYFKKNNINGNTLMRMNRTTFGKLIGEESKNDNLNQLSQQLFRLLMRFKVNNIDCNNINYELQEAKK